MSDFLKAIIFFLIFLEITLTFSKFLLNVYLTHTIKKNAEPSCLPNPITSTIPNNIKLSIHIPTRAEPFPVVRACLESILSQLGVDDEIIVIDNNHTNQEHYLPLKKYCEERGIIFEHQDYIPGYKAGALNVALSQTSKVATHVLIMDCDYVLEPHALERIKVLSKKAAEYGFIQFPQAYRVEHQKDVENELNKYFLYNLYINRYRALGTGSLCCINKNALKQIHGWPTQSITEDALFGVEMQTIGKYGLYIPEIMGRGFLPQHIKDFFSQRKRWIYGNAQVLIQTFSDAPFKKLSLGNISQLTTWLNFAAMTFFIHLLLIVATVMGYEAIYLWFGVYTHYVLLFITKFYEFYQLPLSLGQQWRAFLIQWQFLYTSSIHWLPVLINKSKEFKRTPKINHLKISLSHLPVIFLILQIITFAINLNHVGLLILSGFFIIIELLSKRVYLSNFKS